MTDLSFQRYQQLDSPQDETDFVAAVNASGYFAFYKFVEDFRQGLRGYSDGEVELYRELLERGARLFPEPGRFSPSFGTVWEEFGMIAAAKNEALSAIPVPEREGEWQVLIDNPFLHQQVVCYPGLPFLEAAYMYGYFQRELKPNECLRLQKVVQLLFTHGRREASIFPT